jgi:hypothetical protein
VTRMPLAIVVDVDGTVALRGDRSPYDERRVHLDRPNAPVVAAVRAMHSAGHLVIYCSGRTDRCRPATRGWLAGQVGIPYEALYMRQAGDTRPDDVVKLEMYRRHVSGHYRVTCVFDDRSRVVRAWRKLGLTVFQVADGEF